MDTRIAQLNGALDNDPVGCLVDTPLFVGAVPEDLVMTSDDWSAVRRIVAETGRPIRFKAIAANDPAQAEVSHE